MKFGRSCMPTLIN